MKVFLCALGMALAVGFPWGAAETLAQPSGQVPRVGILLGRSGVENEANLASFLLGLREYGWIAGQNIVIETRVAAGNPAQYRKLAEELLDLKVSVIVTAGEPLIEAVKQANPSIPIVMAAVGDPIGRGFAASLARPGGSITGVSNLAVGLPAKWLELLKEALPNASRIAVLRNLSNRTHDTFWSDAQAGAKTLGLTVVSVGIRTSADIDEAFTRIAQANVDALLLLPDPITGAQAGRIAAQALLKRLPSVALFRENVVAGVLMSYGPDLRDNHRRAAGYVDKILRGANPGDLPIEQARQFNLVINLKTAKALGLTIPQTLLLRADEVIR